MRNLIALFCGGLFGAGLLVSGMTDTTKVIGWLDLFGDWDPTLAFVLGGAILPMIFAWQIANRRENSLLGTTIPARIEPKIGQNLMYGSILFGIGWGLSGLCPGPAMASITYGGIGGLVFLAAMSAGMLISPKVIAKLK